MDRNLLLGQVLLSEGLITKELMLQASDELKGQFQLDLCDWFVERQLITSGQADKARFKVNMSASAKMLSTDQPIRRRPSESQVVAARKTFERGSSAQPSFGNYKIERELFQGPESVIYAAIHRETGTQLALKTLSSSRLVDTPTLQRFLLDAKANAQLSHPNIIPIHDFGQLEGQAFVAMELVQGRSLAEWIREKGPMEAMEAAKCALKIARALSYSHQRGLLHRDLKPSSILIRDHDQEPMLTDFGFRGAPRKRTTTLQEGLEYTAPELANGEIEFIDQRVDIYALGATLYYLLTGRGPYENHDRLDSSIWSEKTVDPRQVNQDIPQDLAMICVTCLQREAAFRYVSALQLASDLERFLSGASIEGSKKRRRQDGSRIGSKLSVLVKILLIVGLSVLAFQGYKGFEHGRERQRQESREAQLAQVESELEDRKNQWLGRLEETFERVESKLTSAPPRPPETSPDSSLRLKDAQQLIEDIDRGLSRYLSPEKTEEFLSKDKLGATLKLGAQELFSERLKKTLATIPASELRARGTRLKGLVWQSFGDEGQARSFWAEAYCEAPRSFDGLLAYLETGESLAKDYQIPKATRILRQLLMAETATKEMKSRACLSLTRLALARGRFEEGVNWLKRGGQDGTEGESAEARLYREITERLAGDATLLSSELGELCVALPDRVVFSRVVGGRRIEMNSLQWNGEALTLSPWIHWSVEENVRRVLVNARKGVIQVVAELGDSTTAALKSFRIRDGKVEEWGQRCALPESLSGHEVLSMGDINNDGRLDVLMRDRAQHNLGTLILDVLSTTPSKLYSIPSRSCCPDARFIDLDGDSREELVLSLGKWSDYRLAIFNWDGPTHQLKLRFDKVLGFPQSLSVRAGRNGRPELLQLVDRRHRFDQRGVFGDDLNPALPDAVWSIQFDSGGKGYQARPLVKWPFSERNTTTPLWHRETDALFPDASGAVLSYIKTKKWGAVWQLHQGSMVTPIQLKMSTELAKIEFADLDGDGDVEAIVVGAQNVRVFGLKARASSKNATVLEEISGVDGGFLSGSLTQLEMAFHLLEMGRVDRGRRALELALKAGGLSELELEAAYFALAETYAQSGQFLIARDQCLKLAKVHPGTTFKALLKSVDYSLSAARESRENGEKLRSLARDHLKRAKELLDRNQSGFAEWKAKLNQLEQQLSMVTVVDWDFSDPSSYPRSIEIFGPEHFLRSQTGLLIHAAGASKVGLQWPLEFRGGPIDIELELSVRWIERHHGFRLSFERVDKSPFSRFEFALNCDGRGDEESCHRSLTAQFGREKGVEWELPGDHFDPTRRMKITLRYDHTGLRREFVCSVGEGQRRNLGAISQQLTPGLYTVGLVPIMRGDVRNSSLASFVEVHKMSVRGLPSLRQGADRKPGGSVSDRLSEAKRALLLGSYREVLKSLSALRARERLDKKVLSSVLQMEGLATARLGESAAATKIFAEARNRDESGFEEFWTRIFPLLGEDVRLSLAPLYFSEADPAYRENQCRRLSQLGERHKALLGLGALNGEGGEWRLFEAQLGLKCGDYSRSLSRLSPLVESNDKARRAAGLYAYKMGDYKKALMFWQRLEIDSGDVEDPLFLHYYRRARQWMERGRTRR